MKKIKTVQIGIRHEHAAGKLQTLLKCLRDEFELVGVVDEGVLPTPTMSYLDDPIFQEPLPFISLEEALAIPDLDCAVIEVPNLELVPYAMKFAEKGVALHVDKPAGEDLTAYKALLDYCEQHGIPFQMGYMYRVNPAFRFVQKLVREGALGEIFEISIDMHHNYGGAEYQKFLENFPGGIMFNLGCHLIDFIVSILGAPDSVTSFLHAAGDVPDSVKNNCMAVLEYPRAIAAVRVCSQKPGGNDTRQLRIAGTKGWCELEPLEHFISVDPTPLELRVMLKDAACGLKEGCQTVSFAPCDRYEDQFRELAAVIRGTGKSSYSFEHDYIVHKATLAAGNYFEWKK